MSIVVNATRITAGIFETVYHFHLVVSIPVDPSAAFMRKPLELTPLKALDHAHKRVSRPLFRKDVEINL
jgi:hypothetical protein